MTKNFDNELLAKRVREKRGERSLRNLAAELQIGIATLSRVENAKWPDVNTLGILIRWLGDDPSMYFPLPEASHDEDTIMGQLRAAQAMSAETADAFMEIIRAAYVQLLAEVSDDEKA